MSHLTNPPLWVPVVLAILAVLTYALAILRRRAGVGYEEVLRVERRIPEHDLYEAVSDPLRTEKVIGFEAALAALILRTFDRLDVIHRRQTRAIIEGRVLYFIALALGCFAVYQFDELQQIRVGNIERTTLNQKFNCAAAASVSDAGAEVLRASGIDQAGIDSYVQGITRGIERRLGAGAETLVGPGRAVEPRTGTIDCSKLPVSRK